MRKLLQPVSILVLTVVAAINFGCGTSSSPATPPPPPSGIIGVTPATSATAPFPLNNPQTFIASEGGYSGSFTFNDTITAFGRTQTLSNPTTPFSVTLKAHEICLLICNTVLQTVVVHDSSGNTTTIYAQ